MSYRVMLSSLWNLFHVISLEAVFEQ